MNAQEIEQVPKQQSPAETKQISLLQMFGWFTLVCLIVSSLTSMVWVPRVIFDSTEPLQISKIFPTALTTIVLIVFYCRLKKFQLLAIQLIPPLAILIICIALQLETRKTISFLVTACALSSLLSFLAMIQSAIVDYVKNTISQHAYFAGCILVWIVMTILFFNIDTLLGNGFLRFDSSVFGFLIGFWLGLNQAVAKSGFKKAKVLGVSMYPAVLAGLIGAITAPLINDFATRQISGAFYMDPTYAPAIGFVAAGLTFATCWAFNQFAARKSLQ